MNSTELLQSRSLRLTTPRKLVLDVFHSKLGKAVSIKSLLESLENIVDKVTLYRTLRTFEEAGLIHRVLDDTGLEKYALCVGTCETHHDHHDHGHLHFKCENCLETECIAEFKLPAFKLPDGYLAKSTNLTIMGQCAKCTH